MMASINEDIQWLVDAKNKLVGINLRIGEMVPDNPDGGDSMWMAHISSAQAIRGCEQTVRYMRAAIKQAMGE